MKDNKITFWGVRGSFPTPDKDKMNVGGHTSCVSLETEENIVIMDMGTGMKNLGDKIISNSNSPKTIDIIMSHLPLDHLIGFPMFAPFFNENFEINIYCNTLDIDLKEILNQLLNPIFWPISINDFKAKINFINLEENEFKISDKINIKTQVHYHPNDAYGYRISSNNKVISYVTDCEYKNDIPEKNLENFVNESDLLIHDSHFTPEDLPSHKGWGHCSWMQAIDLTMKSKSKQLALFHHNPNYTDTQIDEIEQKAKKVFKNTFAARQGLVIYL